MQPLPISPPRFPPHLSPPRSRPGSDAFVNMVPTHVDVRARALSLSQPKPVGTTAQDLLNGVLGLQSSTNDPAPAATPIYSGLGGLTSSVWSPTNGVGHLPIGQQRHQRSVSQFNPSFAPGTRPGNGIGNGLGLTTGLSPFLPSSSLPQPSSQPYWQSNQPSQPHTDITPHPRLNPIGHHRAQSSGVPPHLTSPSSTAGSLLNSRLAQPIPDAPINLGPTDKSGGSNDLLTRRGLSPASQTLSYNLPFGNSLGIQGSGWER
jgi:hypothetical protein